MAAREKGGEGTVGPAGKKDGLSGKASAQERKKRKKKKEEGAGPGKGGGGGVLAREK